MNRFPIPYLASLLLIVSSSAGAEPDLSGIWMLSGRAVEGDLVLTDEARRIQGEYDLLVDDPSLYCEPASISRVWANPNVRVAFEQTESHLLVSYEFFDLRRLIPLGDENVIAELPSTRNVDGTLFQKMGSSFAHYDGDRLTIETRNHSPGYIRTSRGVPQAETTVSIEDLWLEEDSLRVKQTYIDADLFEKPFVVEYSFERLNETEMPLYECTDANYDWFNQLNSPVQEESQ